jgi:hypothetical protein
LVFGVRPPRIDLLGFVVGAFKVAVDDPIGSPAGGVIIEPSIGDVEVIDVIRVGVEGSWSRRGSVAWAAGEASSGRMAGGVGSPGKTPGGADCRPNMRATAVQAIVDRAAMARIASDRRMGFIGSSCLRG